MPGNNNDVENKLEAAVVAALERKLNDEFDGHQGLTDDDLALPHFSAHVPHSDEVIQGTGTMICDLEVKFKTDVDDEPEEGVSVKHADGKGKIWDAILTDPMSLFIADLNAAGIQDFTAFVLKEVGRETGVEGRALVSTLKLQVICCGSEME